MTIIEKKVERFYQWLAGFIDGDGYFYIDSKNHPHFEVTTNLDDIHVLQQIKQYFPGSLKIRSGVNAIRLRISKKEVLEHLVFVMNGRLQYVKRRQQLQKLCKFFNIACKDPESLTIDNAYLAGLIDSDGTLTISVSKTTAPLSIEKGIQGKIHRLQYSRGYHQMKCRISSIDNNLMNLLVDSYGFGKVYSQNLNEKRRNPNIIYHWTCQSLEDIQLLLNYTQNCSLRSIKRQRFFLIPRYLYLKANNYHLSQDKEIGHKIWSLFCKKWFDLKVKDMVHDRK